MPVSRLDPIASPLPAYTPATLHGAAAVYAVAGLPVFPCAPGEKRPLTEHGFHDATTDLRQVERWWRRTPEANIGIATGTGVDVLDIDVHALGTGFPVLRSLRQAGLVDGWAQAVRSPSGGLHLYYPSGQGRELRSWSRGQAHLDFRGRGGYIIAPPSTVLTEHGLRRYEVIARGRHPRPVDADAIRDLLTPTPEPRKPSAAPGGAVDAGRLAEWVSRLPEGNRNAGLFWAACRLTEAGLSLAETQAVLEPAGIAAALNAREITATIRSAHRTTQLTPNPPTSSPGAASASSGIRR